MVQIPTRYFTRSDLGQLVLIKFKDSSVEFVYAEKPFRAISIIERDNQVTGVVDKSTNQLVSLKPDSLLSTKEIETFLRLIKQSLNATSDFYHLTGEFVWIASNEIKGGHNTQYSGSLESFIRSCVYPEKSNSDIVVVNRVNVTVSDLYDN